MSYGKTILLATSVSLVGHGVLFAGLRRAADEPRQARHRPIEIAVLVPEPPAEMEPPPPPEPEPRPAPRKAPKVVAAPPPSNSAAPPEAEPSSEPPPPPVFGVTLSSVVGPGSGSGFRVRVGNTLMKEPEAEPTPVAEVEPYVQPVTPLHRVDALPKKLHECQAPYPKAARSSGVEGRIRLEVEVLPTGQVGTVRVLSGLGYGLDEAAARALRKCRFEPATVGGRAVATRIPYTYTFVIES